MTSRYVARFCALAGLVVSGAGCSETPTSTTESSIPSGGQEHAQLPLVPGLLGMTDEQRVVLQSAEDELISECMSSRGFDYVRLPRDTTSDTFSMSSLYGSIAPATAERFGYHNPEAGTAARLERQLQSSLTKIEAQGRDDYLRALDECTIDMAHELYGDDVRPSDSSRGARLISLSARAQERIGSDERLAAANEDWVRCMSTMGYRFKFMSDARAQFQFEPTDTSAPSEDEVSLAVSDATCRQEVEVDALISSLYAAALADLLQNQEELTGDLEVQLSDATSTAEVIVGD